VHRYLGEYCEEITVKNAKSSLSIDIDWQWQSDMFKLQNSRTMVRKNVFQLATELDGE